MVNGRRNQRRPQQRRQVSPNHPLHYAARSGDRIVPEQPVPALTVQLYQVEASSFLMKYVALHSAVESNLEERHSEF